MSTQSNFTMTGTLDKTSNQDNLAEQIWQKLNGAIPYTRVSQVVAEAAAKFQDATITSYVPIFIQRYAYEKLGQEMQSKDIK